MIHVSRSRYMYHLYDIVPVPDHQRWADGIGDGRNFPHGLCLKLLPGADSYRRTASPSVLSAGQWMRLEEPARWFQGLHWRLHVPRCSSFLFKGPTLGKKKKTCNIQFQSFYNPCSLKKSSPKTAVPSVKMIDCFSKLSFFLWFVQFWVDLSTYIKPRSKCNLDQRATT